MPPKRRATETETPNNPNTALPGQPEVLLPAAQPAPATAKRQRVSRACDQCRAARERCDGKQPRCHPCVSQSRPCTYEVSPKKRGVQTGYIRTLELALGWVFEKVPNSEETLSALLAQDSGQGHSLLAGKDPGGVDRLQKRWRKSRVHRGIDRILSGETVPSLGQGGLSPSADASDTEGGAARARTHPDSIAPDTETATQDTPSSRRMSFGHCPPITPSGDPLGPGQPRQMPPLSGRLQCSQVPSGYLKLPADHWRLLDIYFSYTHSWLPILEKQDLFQASYLYPDHGLAINPKDPSSAVHAELWAALALASFQDAASSKSFPSEHTDPEGPHPNKIYDTARGLLPSEHGPFQVHHARASLLLSLVNLGQEKLTGAGLLAGAAIRILLDPDTTQCGAQNRNGQRMELTTMSCFLVDTILSMRCSRPPHLRAEDLTALPSASESGLDQWEPWTPCEGFGAANTGSRSSRSPAFCLSTFNQLYAIITVVARETSKRRQGLSPRGESSSFATQLQQAIDPNLPFGDFVISPTCGTASVPTPYLVRATYLWASAVAEPHAETLLTLLDDTLNKYQRLFGRSSTPPFIPTCIASFANEEHLLRCSEQNREILRGLVSTHSSRRLKERRSSSVHGSQPIPLSRPAQDPFEMPSAPHLSAPSNSTTNYPAPIMPPHYSNMTATQHHRPHASNRGYGSFLAPGMGGSYQPPFTNSVAISQGSNMHMQYPGTGMVPMSGIGTATAPTHRDHPSSHSLIPLQGFGPSPDYDALLDDLASIECVDAVDIDAQVMANLGFAPGCDITEILTRDFGV
ncbi:hypothetical protein C8A00DRAFT_15417 [Chaetomidium leptoderma]|uniref:Zn(2)-C6 fungal-type domain-containing protein n=1 Tax=Chaetomidium leptoderma TaxID=669021 RepID=A0AAN6VL97_9PEZI|nr:hypothetical protein C8A00DRAFT_15417 [Chaetomidium leptoderma]